MHSACTEMRFGQQCQALLSPDVVLLTTKGLVFKFHARPTQSPAAMCWVLQLMGPPAEAANWKYQIQINKKGDSVRKLQLSDMCLHEDDDINKVLDEGGCPSAAFKILENFLQNNSIGLRLNIIYSKGQ